MAILKFQLKPCWSFLQLFWKTKLSQYLQQVSMVWMQHMPLYQWQTSLVSRSIVTCFQINFLGRQKYLMGAALCNVNSSESRTLQWLRICVCATHTYEGIQWWWWHRSCNPCTGSKQYTDSTPSAALVVPLRCCLYASCFIHSAKHTTHHTHTHILLDISQSCQCSEDL